MKEKIIDFFNGTFVYDQTKLKIEPQELNLELEEGKSVQGSFVVHSCDERRVKGALYSKIPGLTLSGNSFFARAARFEYTYEPKRLRPGEMLEDFIWLETSAGEYELPVRVKIREVDHQAAGEELSLPELAEPEIVAAVLKKGSGRSEEWILRRSQESALVQVQLLIEKEKRRACTKEEADVRLRELVDELLELNPESAIYPLLDAWVMLREDREEEAGWILRKYERTRLFQQRDLMVRALFLYVNSLFRKDRDLTAASVAQLQKIYQKRPENWFVTAFLLELDEKIKDKARTRYLMLERQFRAGARNRLLYQEAWNLLKEDIALFTKLDPFTVQVFGWAASRGLLTSDAALVMAAQASRFKNWSPLAARLLKACYQVEPCKETVGAVCAIYIRGHRMDEEAFVWYHKGVELDAKITNLYEYFMYALPVSYAELLPKQVLLYFHYHNTLTSRQKTALFCNLVRYGKPGDMIYEEYKRSLQEFLLQQLKERRLNESLAWLYGKCLMVETLDEDILEALADLLFMRKLTCKEKRIRKVEICYPQLEEKIDVPVVGGVAYIPVYTPCADIALVDDQGHIYRQTVAYDLKRVLIEPKFLQTCTLKLKKHLGLNLYLLDGNGTHRLKDENAELVWRLAQDERLKESYRQQLKLEILEYERKRRRLEKMDDRLRLDHLEVLSRSDQAAYIEVLILLKEDMEALELLEQTGCRLVNPKILVQLLQRLLTCEEPEHERLMPYARLAFEKGICTENTVLLLAQECKGATHDLLAIWKAGEQFGLLLPELEEHILAQALFTERHVNEVFPVYQSLDDRGGESVIGSAYLNYLSWQDFIKGNAVPDGLFDSLEHHLIWDDRLAEVSVLSYLRQLSALLLLSDAQKRLVKRLMKELVARRRKFAFMSKLLPYMEEPGRPDDQIILEYRCNPTHKVILHYVLEYHGKKTFDYVTEGVYPVCGGVFTKAFTLFYGERLTWFFTETLEDGTEISTECKTVENKEEQPQGNSRYHRLCRMQRALDRSQERSLKRMMIEYEELTVCAEQQFKRR